MHDYSPLPLTTPGQKERCCKYLKFYLAALWAKEDAAKRFYKAQEDLDLADARCKDLLLNLEKYVGPSRRMVPIMLDDDLYLIRQDGKSAIVERLSPLHLADEEAT